MSKLYHLSEQFWTWEISSGRSSKRRIQKMTRWWTDPNCFSSHQLAVIIYTIYLSSGIRLYTIFYSHILSSSMMTLLCSWFVITFISKIIYHLITANSSSVTWRRRSHLIRRNFTYYIFQLYLLSITQLK